MSIRKIDHTYIKTRGANTNDILRVNSGNLEYVSGNSVVVQALYGLAGDNITIAANGDRKSTRLNSSHIPLSRMPSSA